MPERFSGYERAANDWYVEPAWVLDRLLQHLPEVSSFHDPCCGMGTLPKRGKALGLATTGADLVKRWPAEEFFQQDFFSDTTRYENIITNPPYLLAEQIVAKALEKNVEGFIAIFVPIRFLASQGRKPLFQNANMHSVVILSSRPSVPPGTSILQFGEAIRKSGSIDFCWCIWKQNHKDVPKIFWS